MAEIEIEPAPELAPVSVIEPKQIELNLERSIDLNLEDCLWANWRVRKPKMRSDAKTFDLQDALNRLKKIEVEASNGKRNLSGYFPVNWDSAKISDSLYPAEANFWMTGMTCDIPGAGGRPCGHWSRKNIEDLCDFLEKINFGNLPDLKQVICALLRTGRFMCSQIVGPLDRLFPIVEIIVELYHFYHSTDTNVIEHVSLVFDRDYIARYNGSHPAWDRDRSIQEIAKTLRQESRSLLKELISGFKSSLYPYLTDEEIELMQGQLRPALNLKTDVLQLYKLAAYLGMHEEIREQVALWQPHPYNIHSITSATGYLEPSDAMEIILGLGNAEEIESNVRRLNLPVFNMRGWLANTGFSALDLVCKSIDSDQQLKLFALVKAPEVAPYMLELWLSLKKPQLARQWLEDYPSYAVVGLIPVVAGTWIDPVRVKLSELKKAAIEFLIGMKRKGHESLIRAALERETPEIAAKVRSLILDIDEPNYTPFDRASTPQWLFERWLTEGAPNKEKWAMMALGLLGSDRIALKLTPLIRTWPGESQHPRAVLGLECLRSIGTCSSLQS